LEEKKKAGTALTEEEDKVASFYASAMDEEACETAGIAPLKAAFDCCEKVNDPNASRAAIIAELGAKFGTSPFFGICAEPDAKDAGHTICWVAQAGLGLPDRDYYFDEDKADKRDAYKVHISKMLHLAGVCENEEAALAATEGVYALELSLAEHHMTKTAQRDPIATYNKMSINDMSKLCADKFDFSTFFKSSGRSDQEVGDVNLMTKDAIIHATSLIESTEANVFVNYLKWQVIHATASYLPKAFVDENFRFNGTVLSGTKELLPRWKRAMSWTEKALGDAIGKLYCKRYFDEAKKEKCLAIIETVR
jgi:putative endopeptidase